MAKVFITHNDGRWDLNDARRFGELITVFHRDIFPDEVDAKSTKYQQIADRLLNDFNFESDYLCLVGSPLLMAFCIAKLSQKWVLNMVHPFQVLRYDRREFAYYPVPLLTRFELVT